MIKVTKIIEKTIIKVAIIIEKTIIKVTILGPNRKDDNQSSYKNPNDDNKKYDKCGSRYLSGGNGRPVVLVPGLRSWPSPRRP